MRVYDSEDECFKLGPRNPKTRQQHIWMKRPDLSLGISFHKQNGKAVKYANAITALFDFKVDCMVALDSEKKLSSLFTKRRPSQTKRHKIDATGRGWLESMQNLQLKCHKKRLRKSSGFSTQPCSRAQRERNCRNGKLCCEKPNRSICFHSRGEKKSQGSG